LLGVEKAMELGWFSFEKFNLDEYECLDRADICGLNWIIPGKFMAFAGPGSTQPAFAPEHYMPFFSKVGIRTIIRLNGQEYNRARFTERGFKHVDLFFKDGSCPSQEIIARFFQATEGEKGGIAVHCKAGLGRTGTLIGLYAMKHFGFPGRAFIGWNRICRPGSILGPQQQFLVSMQQEMFSLSGLPRAIGGGGQHLTAAGERAGEHHGAGNGSPGSTSRRYSAPLSDRDRNVMESYEDHGQGERLCNAKQRGPGVGDSVQRGRSCPSPSSPSSVPAPPPPLHMARSGSPSSPAAMAGGRGGSRSPDPGAWSSRLPKQDMAAGLKLPPTMVFRHGEGAAQMKNHNQALPKDLWRRPVESVLKERQRR